MYNIFLKSLGITISIIRDPISSDLDNSKKIDAKEAAYLGVALSIDSICIGIGISVIGLSSLVFPILTAIFQLLFLSVGTFLGKRIITTSNIPDNIWNIISGILLILIGLSRFIL